MEFTNQFRDDVLRSLPRLQERAPDHQEFARTISFEVAARDERVTQ